MFGRKKENNKPAVGLVLGGGGARGFVQVGALKAFKESNINFDLCVGTSVGSIVGALYCAGVDPDEIISISDTLNMGDFHGKIIFKPDDPRRIGEVLANVIGDVSIESLKVKYAAVATDLKTGKQVVIDRGSVIDAVSASSAVPILYAPLAKDGMALCDGGLTNNIPADVCKMLGADKVVTVDAHGTRGSGTDGTGLFDTLKAMFSIMNANASVVGLMQSDIVIAPDTAAFKATSKSGYMQMIELGYNATMAKRDEIKALFEHTKE
ncbi:MAG: patatin-like phospholipase family protein [Clostridiales bacterium]|nr:patatin-like phospholipase family protein [Clostridiales bacterium]